MLVKNLASWAGPNFSYEPGDVIEMPDAMAEGRIAAGLATAHSGEPELPTIRQHPGAPSPAKVKK